MEEEIKNTTDSTTVNIRRGRIDSIDIYEIKDIELDSLERGNNSDDLTFSVFLLSMFFTSLAALMTADFTSEYAKIIFTVACFIGLILGIYFFSRWYKNRNQISIICNKIRDRIKPIKNKNDIDKNITNKLDSN